MNMFIKLVRFLQRKSVRNPLFIFLILIIFFLSLSVRSLPLIHKGYVIIHDHTQLVLARNLDYGLGYRMETKDGMILSSSLVEGKAMNAPDPYFGTSLIYALLFKLFGFNGNMFLPMIVTLLTHALITVLFFILVKRLFNYYIALVFVFFEIFLPIIIRSSLMVELYEFASLFFVIGLLFYLFKKERPSGLRLLGAGLFFTLAVVSRNAFLFSYGAFVLYEFYKNRSFKRILLFISPLIVLLVAVVFYAIPNNYASTFIGGMIHESTPSFQSYGHFYPDPYTYNYDQTDFFATGGKIGNYAEPFHNYGQIYSLKSYLSIYYHLFISYISGFLDLIQLGGALIALLFVFGCIYLYRQNKDLFQLLVIWLSVWFFSFVVLTRTDNWTHYLELEFIIVLAIALGFYWMLKMLWDSSFFGKRVKFVLVITIFLFTMSHLVQANRWMLHEEYTGDMQQAIETVAKYVNTKNLTNKDVIAVGMTQRAPYALNYFTDLNYVYFDPSTLERLLSENRIKEAFTRYKVDKILGYTPELSEKVIKATGVENLASHIHIQEEKNVIIYPGQTVENSL